MNNDKVKDWYDEEYEQEPTIMVENPKVWKDDLEKIENDLCAEMTEEQFKAYKYGIELFYSWIKQIVDANCKNGCVTVLTSNEDVTPEEFTWDEFVKCKYSLPKNNEYVKSIEEYVKSIKPEAFIVEEINFTEEGVK